MPSSARKKKEVIYSDDHALIGRTLPPRDELENALRGKPNSAAVVDPGRHSETASVVGLGPLVEVSERLLDLYNVKERINALGSSTGHHVLLETDRRLQRRLGEHARVARLGGDDFALLCPSAEGEPCSLACAAAQQDLHSFPTRRSSD